VRLDIYGDGVDKEHLLQMAAELGLLNRHVFFKGKFNNADVEKIYSYYHAFILLSKFETFSVVTAEALAYGLPVIITKCGAPEEYVVNELNGYLVEINNLEQTKSAIFSLIRNYSKFDATTIQNTVKVKFSKEKVIESFKHLYDVK
ncbi:MAG: glycosyltransferase, partial [Bacteroidetes bacterium]